MPRLRYMKPRLDEIEPVIPEFEDEDEHEPTPVEQDIEQGQSWLSNASVIACIPDAKLRGAIAFHRQMLAMLEQELRARDLSAGASRAPLRVQDIGSFHAVTSVQPLRAKAHAKRPPSSKRSSKQRVGLTRTQILLCLHQLAQLRRTKTNEKETTHT